MRERLGLKCEFVLKVQSDFSEPLIRINTDVADDKTVNWNEKTAWDEVAEYYAQLMTRCE